jgi:beta-xylosidase
MTSHTPTLPNPLIPGFHPDPSICRVGDDYYVACSSFEYLPGIPLFHSTDLQSWELIGHVVDRPDQLAVDSVPTGGGAWAPTIRHHDGLFWCVVTDAMGRGSLIFTAENPSGPWSDGTVMQGMSGIDPDIAWDDDGMCYVTYSGLLLDVEDGIRHKGIQQVRLDPRTGRALEEPRSLWSGTGLIFPEAPHLYRIGEWWYVMIAEGGTERGHCVSIARSTSPTGPFEGCPANPLLSARSTDRPVQNTGHGDLVQLADGSWAMVLLGVRPRSMTRAFSPMGRETFATTVEWQDGWPVVTPVHLSERGPSVEVVEDFDEPELGPDWVGIRRHPREIASLGERSGSLRLKADGSTMSDPKPVFVGRRQEHEAAQFEALLDVSQGRGGLCLRYDEDRHASVEAGAGTVRGQVRLGAISQTWERPLPADTQGVVRLRIWAEPPAALAMGADVVGCDLLHLSVHESGEWVDLAAVDGRYWSAEVAESFTGRVVGLYAVDGIVDVESLTYRGEDVAR